MTRQEAINEKCKDCIHDPLDKGTWRDQTTNCTIKSCSLYEYRPVNAATDAARLAKRKESMTPQQREAYERKVENARKLQQSRG